MRDYKKELQKSLAYGREKGFKVLLVEANPEKGFNYSYFIYIPNHPQMTIMMDCLNDYEDEMLEGQTENLQGLEEIYNLFEDSEIVRSGSSIQKEMEVNNLKSQLYESQNLANKYMNIFRKSFLSRVFSGLKKEDIENDKRLLS